MPDFNPVTLSDISWIKPIIIEEDTKNADFSFANIFAWAEVYDVKTCNIDGCLVIRLNIEGKPSYSFPICSKNEDTIRNVILKLIDYSTELGEVFNLQSICPEKISMLEMLFPGEFDIIPETDLFDYIYLAEKLSSLSGKKLHAKRNFVNRFILENEWSYEPVTEDNIHECMAMEGLWVSNKHNDLDTVDGELTALKRCLENFKALDLDGGLLRVSGVVCAFTIGEKLSCDTYVVHFEKALQAITGAYPMINREFVRNILEKYPEIIYINREDDMGIENLRKAKRSYYPEFMVEKYMAVKK